MECRAEEGLLALSSKEPMDQLDSYLLLTFLHYRHSLVYGSWELTFAFKNPVIGQILKYSGLWLAVSEKRLKILERLPD